MPKTVSRISWFLAENAKSNPFLSFKNSQIVKINSYEIFQIQEVVNDDFTKMQRN